MYVMQHVTRKSFTAFLDRRTPFLYRLCAMMDYYSAVRVLQGMIRQEGLSFLLCRIPFSKYVCRFRVQPLKFTVKNKMGMEVRSHNHCCHGKAINITYSGCVSVTLVIQHAKRMRDITFSSAACLTYHIFPHYLIHGTIFGQMY